jgi:probable F420-dependent oxidoreductase
MRVGAVFPQLESGDDPIAIRDYAQAIEGLGFTHILGYDHVLGAATNTRPDWSGPYTSESLFHELFVLYGYLAGLTQKLELVTGIVILPQRQTALVAKQAAEVDLLSGGRLRLGVGVGWNEVEYEGLNENFKNRGVRSEEQIALLRELWTAHAIDFKGRWHTIDNAGLNPLPPRRSIPIWIGGYSEATLQRVGAMGDGWFPWRPPSEEMRAQIERVREYARAAGRDPATIGFEPQLTLARVPEAEWGSYVEGWRELGATHLCVNTMGHGLATLDDHVKALERVKASI